MRIIDTHAHYDDEAFDPDRSELLARGLKEGDVELAVNMGASMRGAEASVELAAAYDQILAGCGIHPDNVGVFEHAGISPEEAEALREGERDERYIEAVRFENADEVMQHLEKLCRDRNCLAVGEIGLDYHWMIEPKETQKKWFTEQLHLSASLDMPINVHSREAAQDTFDTIKEEHSKSGCGGIIHCYSGSVDMARDYVRMGYMIGIGGVVTFKNSKVLKRVVREIPLNYLVTETDSPYLAPSPHRGSRNDSRNIRFVIESIAAIKEMETEACANALRQNALRVYRIAED